MVSLIIGLITKCDNMVLICTETYFFIKVTYCTLKEIHDLDEFDTSALEARLDNLWCFSSDALQCERFAVEGGTGGGLEPLWRKRSVGGCVCIHQPTPGLWSVKEALQKTAAARHPDKTLQIVPLIKKLSCRNTIDSKRKRQNSDSPPSHNLHINTLPCSFFSPLADAQIAPKIYAYRMNPGMAAICGVAVVCKWRFCLSLRGLQRRN